MEKIENKTIYQLTLWEIGERWGQTYPIEFDTPEAAEYAAEILIQTGKYSSITIRKEDIILRTENTEISANGVYMEVYPQRVPFITNAAMEQIKRNLAAGIAATVSNF